MVLVRKLKYKRDFIIGINYNGELNILLNIVVKQNLSLSEVFCLIDN